MCQTDARALLLTQERNIFREKHWNALHSRGTSGQAVDERTKNVDCACVRDGAFLFWPHRVEHVVDERDAGRAVSVHRAERAAAPQRLVVVEEHLAVATST
eukprot:5174563-Pleurochrysis_carterae.AAC.1